MSGKLAVLGCGLMGSGIASLAAPEAELILIDREAERARALADRHHAAWSMDLRDAAEAEIVCAVLPAPVTEEAFRSLAEVLAPGALALNMSTTGQIPPDVKERRPDVRFLEAKIVGAGVGVEAGLRPLLVTDAREESVLSALRAALPGFAEIVPGDPALVPRVNALGAYWGVRAAVETEEALRQMGLPVSWVRAAVGCLVPGSTLGYCQGRMGAFNRAVAEQVLAEIREKKKTEA